MSLAACSGSTIVFLLRRMKKTVTGLKVHAKGIRREKHPTSFETIHLDFTLHSPDANEGDMQKAVQLSEETYCPVWAMLKNNVEVTTKYSKSVDRSQPAIPAASASAWDEPRT